jgi:hypothetical protein
VAKKGVVRGGWVHGKKGLQVIGITVIREKRGIQWDMSRIRVTMGTLYSLFLNLVVLYSDLKNIAVKECQNY